MQCAIYMAMQSNAEGISGAHELHRRTRTTMTTDGP